MPEIGSRAPRLCRQAAICANLIEIQFQSVEVVEDRVVVEAGAVQDLAQIGKGAAAFSRVYIETGDGQLRLNAGTLPQLSLREPAVVPVATPAGSTLAIAPTAYSLGTARGYASFAQNSTKPAAASPIRQLESPDLASFQPRSGGSGAGPARLSPRIALDEHQKTGRSPRTFEQSDQQVDLGGSYRLSRNLDVTAGVRVTSDRDRLRPLTDSRQDNQAVYVGTQFRF